MFFKKEKDAKKIGVGRSGRAPPPKKSARVNVTILLYIIIFHFIYFVYTFEIAVHSNSHKGVAARAVIIAFYLT